MGKEDARADSRRRLRESGSQTDGEDAFDEADGHCRGASAKLDEVSEKLDKVLIRLGELEAMQGRVAELEKENKNLQESLNTAQADIDDLNSSSTATCATLETHAKNLEDLSAKIKHLECRNIKLEAYTRRENLKVFNIPEGRGESTSAEDQLKKMMRDKLKIPEEDIELIRFERVHRIPTKKNTSQGQNSKPRPIIAKFSFFQDKEYVWSFVKNLKNTNISIANDFPREIDEIQKTLYPVLKKAKQKKQTAYFKVDKLIINGQIYRGEETTNLPYYGLIMDTRNSGS